MMQVLDYSLLDADGKGYREIERMMADGTSWEWTPDGDVAVFDSEANRERWVELVIEAGMEVPKKDSCLEPALEDLERLDKIFLDAIEESMT